MSFAMDFALPDENTMELMLREYASSLRAAGTQTLSFSYPTKKYENVKGDDVKNGDVGIDGNVRCGNRISGNDTCGDAEYGGVGIGSGAKCGDNISDNDTYGTGSPTGPPQNRDVLWGETGLLLFLYFIKLLRYNIGYGTAILNADRGLGKLRPVECAFGKLNNLV